MNLRRVCLVLLLLLFYDRLLYNRLRSPPEDRATAADSSNLFLSSGPHHCSGLKNALLLLDVYDAKTDVKLGGIIKPLAEIEEPNYNMTWKLKIPPRHDHGVRFEGDYENFLHELHDRLRIHGTVLLSSDLNRAKTIFGGRLEGMQWYGKWVSSNGTSFFHVKDSEWNNQANKIIACHCAVNTVAKTDGFFNEYSFEQKWVADFTNAMHITESFFSVPEGSTLSSNMLTKPLRPVEALNLIL